MDALGRRTRRQMQQRECAGMGCSCFQYLPGCFHPRHAITTCLEPQLTLEEKAASHDHAEYGSIVSPRLTSNFLDTLFLTFWQRHCRQLSTIRYPLRVRKISEPHMGHHTLWLLVLHRDGRRSRLRLHACCVLFGQILLPAGIRGHSSRQKQDQRRLRQQERGWNDWRARELAERE